METGPIPAAGAASAGGPSTRSILLHGLAAALMFPSPLTMFVPAAVLSSGLRTGRRGLWLSTAAAAALLAILATAIGSPGAYTPVARMLLEVGLPSALGLELVLRGALLGPVLLATIAASVGGFGLVELAMRAFASYSPYEAIVANFRAQSASSIEAYRDAGIPAEAISMMQRIATGIADSYMPVLIAIVTILTFALSYTMLPRLRSGRPYAPRLLFRFLSFPDPLLFAFIAGGLAPLASGTLRTIGLSLLAVVAFLYMLQGLAVLRFQHVRSRMRLLGTTLAMLTIVVLAFYGITPVVLFLVGLFDPFFDFRHLHRKEVPHESDSD
ncbi:MAG TPA: DUF2232 domain-containing protein [Thermoanaerobaculia bacterium]